MHMSRCDDAVLQSVERDPRAADCRTFWQAVRSRMRSRDRGRSAPLKAAATCIGAPDAGELFDAKVRMGSYFRADH